MSRRTEREAMFENLAQEQAEIEAQNTASREAWRERTAAQQAGRDAADEGKRAAIGQQIEDMSPDEHLREAAGWITARSSDETRRKAREMAIFHAAMAAAKFTRDGQR